MTTGLAYVRRGDGPPLVLLHGVGHRWQAWEPVLDLLAPHRTVIALDLPGHGESPPLSAVAPAVPSAVGPGAGTGPEPGRQAVEAMVAAVLGFLDDLGLQCPHVAGSSLGGALALTVAARGRAASVTGLSPAGFWASGWQFPYVKAMFTFAELTGTAAATLIPLLARTVAGRAVMDAAFVARPGRISPGQAADDAYAFLRARPAVAAVLASKVSFTETIPPGVPVTVAWGSRDRLLTPGQGRLARQRLPQARFIELPGCGHVPMTDDPELVARVLLDGSAGDSADGDADRGAVAATPTGQSRTSGASASRISLARSTALPSSAAGSPTSGSKFRS